MKTAMADNNSALIKQWIQYLKNNQIVGLKSDPQTGRLDYRRPVTPDDVTKFLETKTDYSPAEISNAIRMVLSRQAIDNANPKISNNTTPRDTNNTSNVPPSLPSPNTPRSTAPEKKYNNNDAEDIDFRDVPNKLLPASSPKKKAPGSFRVPGNKTIHEAIEDIQPHSLGEKDIESIFSMLTSLKPELQQQQQQQQAGSNRRTVNQKSAQVPDQQKSPEDAEAKRVKKEEDIRKLKRVIRNTMTPTQRKALWRALNE